MTNDEQSWLKIPNLMDDYERRARLLPGLIVAIPIALGVASLLGGEITSLKTLSVGILLEAIFAVILSHTSRIAGRFYETKQWALWGGPPTTRWLRPTDTSLSEQQKQQLYSALQELTGLEVKEITKYPADDQRIDSLIEDAIRTARYKLREDTKAKMLTKHNIEYGFARNLAGMRWMWILSCTVGVGMCIGSFMLGYKPVLVMIIEAIMFTLAFSSLFFLPSYVKQCAERYAESLFASVISSTPSN